MKEKVKNFYNKNICKYIIIFIVTIVFCIPMFNNKLNVYYDDGVQHIARAMGTEESIKDGTFLGNIINNFANSFGYSWNLFYGISSTIGIIVCKLILRTYVNGYKLFMFICLFLSGCMMFKMLKRITDNGDISLLAGILYLSFPYHLTDLYTRNAVGEFVSFIFIPLVFLGLYNLIHNKDNYYYLAVGIIGLLLTHNLSALIVCFFAGIYFLINIKCIKENYVQKGISFTVLFVILCTAFFVFPLIETKFTTDYAVYGKDVMASKESFIARALELKQLFVTKNGDFSFEIGIHLIIMLGFSRMVYKYLEDDKKKNYLFCLITGLICIWMTTKYFPWKFIPDFYSIVQFPWRFLGIGVFFLSIVASINMGIVIKKFNIKDIIVMTVISGLLAYAVVLIPYNEEPVLDYEFAGLGNMSGKDVECVAGLGKEEYLPVKAYNNKFYIASREKGAVILEGNGAIISELKQNGTYVADINSLEGGIKLELPYIYYPGYKVTADGIRINTFETENGFLGVLIDDVDSIKIEVEYVGTKVTGLSALISAIGFIILGVYIWKKH